MGYFDKNIRQNDHREQQVIGEAVKRATAPNAPSAGNAAGVTGGFTNLVTATPGTIETVEIGIDEDGNATFPFVVGVDYVGKPGAQVKNSNRRFDFGN